jgi:hypothetical protein
MKIPDKDGRINLSGDFYGWLWRKGKYIYISFIESLKPGQGNLLRLFDDILKQGYGIKVPTPFARMQMICEKNNFKHTYEEPEKDDPYDELCEVWVLEPGSKLKSVLLRDKK